MKTMNSITKELTPEKIEEVKNLFYDPKVGLSVKNSVGKHLGNLGFFRGKKKTPRFDLGTSVTANRGNFLKNTSNRGVFGIVPGFFKISDSPRI